jgi:CRP-like cAMP-binding protein
MVDLVEKTFRTGETIITEGHFASNLYILREGGVEVVKQSGNGKQIQVGRIGPGEFFGEMSLLDPKQSINSATVRATELARVAIIKQEDFDQFLGQITPGMKKLVQNLVYKLRKTSARLLELSYQE